MIKITQSTIFTKSQYGPESSTYGTEAGSYAELHKVQSGNITSDNGFIIDRGLGEGLNGTNIYYGQFTASGSVTYNPIDFDFLKHFIGPKTGAGTAGDPYILTEATSIGPTSTLVPFSLEVLNDTESTNDVTVCTGCVGNDFSISANIDQKAVISANFPCQKTKQRTTGETYTASTTAAFISLGGSWKWGATPTALSGVQNWTINYSNNLVQPRSLESRFINQPQYGFREYTFTVSIKMAAALASTIIANFYGKTTGSVHEPEDGSTSISPTSSLEWNCSFVNGSRNAVIQLDECAISNISKPFELGDGLVIMSFQGVALKAKSNIMIQWWTA